MSEDVPELDLRKDYRAHAMLPFEVELWNRACDARDRVNAGGHVRSDDIDMLLGWADEARSDKSRPRSDAMLAAAKRVRRSLPGDIWHVDEYWKNKGGRKDIHRGPAKVFGPLPDLALLVVAVERNDAPSLCTIKAIEARLLNESDRKRKVPRGRKKNDLSALHAKISGTTFKGFAGEVKKREVAKKIKMEIDRARQKGMENITVSAIERIMTHGKLQWAEDGKEVRVMLEPLTQQ